MEFQVRAGHWAALAEDLEGRREGEATTRANRGFSEFSYKLLRPSAFLLQADTIGGSFSEIFINF